MTIRSKRKGGGSAANRQLATAARTRNRDARYAKFIAAYVEHNNATRAAIEAGYSPKSAHAQGYALLKIPEIRDAVDRAQQAVLEAREQVQRQELDRYEVNTARITRELALLGFANMADYISITPAGEPVLDLSELNRDQAAAINSFRVKRTTRRIGETDVTETEAQIKLSDKRMALVDLGKITGLFSEGPDITIPVQFIVEWVKPEDKAA